MNTLSFTRKPTDIEFNIHLKTADNEYWEGLEFGIGKEEAINFARIEDAVKHAQEQAALYGQPMFIEISPIIEER